MEAAFHTRVICPSLTSKTSILDSTRCVPSLDLKTGLLGVAPAHGFDVADVVDTAKDVDRRTVRLQQIASR
jgi:hypothetical protein